jgi:hypothetical protein
MFSEPPPSFKPLRLMFHQPAFMGHQIHGTSKMSFLWYGGFLLVAAASFLFSYHELVDGRHHPTVEVHRVAVSAAVGQAQSDPKIAPAQPTHEWGPAVVVGTAQAHETPAIGPAEIARKNARASTSKRATRKTIRSHRLELRSHERRIALQRREQYPREQYSRDEYPRALGYAPERRFFGGW